MTRIQWVIALGMVVAAVMVMPAASGERPPGYAGSKLCAACHKKPNEAIVTAQPHTPHASALWAIADTNEDHKVLGDFSASSGLKAADVAWVLGKGKRAQGYLDKNLAALPQEWNVSTKQWQPGQTGDAKKSCLGCHTTGYDPASALYGDAGVTCEACHGAGSNHAKSSDKKATIVRPSTLPVERQAMICGRCHSRGKNAEGLPFAAGFVPGDDLSKSFTLDAQWEPGARNSQYNDLVAGKHLKNNVTCTTCHDSHGVNVTKGHQLRKPADELCLGCHAADKLKGAQHTPAQDCTRCHMHEGSHQFEKPESVPAGTPHYH